MSKNKENIYISNLYLFLANNAYYFIDPYGLNNEIVFEACIVTEDVLNRLSIGVRGDFISFWDSLQIKAEDLFDFLRNRFPVEHFIGKEYGTKFYYNYKCCGMKCFAKLWQDFTPYSRKRAEDIFNNSFEYLFNAVNSPVGNLPIVSEIFTILSIAQWDDKYLKGELTTMMNNPQLINEEHFQLIFKYSTHHYINK